MKTEVMDCGFCLDLDNNTIKHNTIAESSTKDVFLQGSTDNSAFNFTFSTIGVIQVQN